MRFYNHCTGIAFAKRYLITLLSFVGVFLMIALRSNLSMALPQMTSDRNITNGNDTITMKAEFNWNSIETGFILSAYSFGTTFSVLGGLCVHRVGGVIMFGAAALISAILTLLSPFLMRLNLFAFLAARAMLGCAEGLTSIGMTDIFMHWSPPKERARLIAISYSGVVWSTAVNFPISGMIIRHSTWETLFYLSGILVLIWSFVWLSFVSNRPDTDKFISDSEKLYLAKEIKYTSESNSEKMSIPWRRIMTSVSVYAILNEIFVSSFVNSFLSTCLPLYVNDVFHMDIQSVGFISGVPILCGCLVVPLAAYVADYLRSNVYDASKVNRIYISIGGIGSLVFLFAAALWSNLHGCMICFCFIILSYSIADSTYQVISIDMAGHYAGTLRALLNVTQSAASFLNPVIIGYFTPNHIQAEWNIYFGFLGVITVYGVIMFFMLGSSDLQPWAQQEVTNTEKRGNDLERDSEIKSAMPY